MDRTTVTRVARAAYGVLAVADTVLAATGRSAPRRVTKPLLMPALAVGRDAGTRRALALSGAGDVALLGTGPTAFTAGLGAFLGGQLAWIRVLRARSAARPTGGLLRRRPLVAVPYVAAAVGLNAVLWRRAGRDRLPVAVYSAALTSMALAAADTGDRATAAGGALFLASDALIALDRFGGVRLPAHEGWVMGTYTAAQALLAHDG